MSVTTFTLMLGSEENIQDLEQIYAKYNLVPVSTEPEEYPLPSNRVYIKTNALGEICSKFSDIHMIEESPFFIEYQGVLYKFAKENGFCNKYNLKPALIKNNKYKMPSPYIFVKIEKENHIQKMLSSLSLTNTNISLPIYVEYEGVIYKYRGDKNLQKRSLFERIMSYLQ